MNSEKKRLSLQEGWISVIANVSLFILKLWAGIATGSLAIIADAWHTLSDSFSSLIVIAGVRISSRPADHEHPFGHGRAELIAALIIGLLLCVVSFNFLMQGIDRLYNQTSVEYGLFAVIATVISIVVKEVLAQYAFRLARKTGSRTLRADAWHHRSDAISSVVILAGIYLGNYIWWIDGAMAIMVAILIFYAAFEILRDSINSLMGETPHSDLISHIKLICLEEAHYDIDPHHIHIHNYGDHQELTMHIRLPGDIDLQEAHNIATKVEKRLWDEKRIISTIHMEPESKTSNQ